MRMRFRAETQSVIPRARVQCGAARPGVVATGPVLSGGPLARVRLLSFCL